MALLLIIIVMIGVLVLFFIYVNTPTKTYKQTQREAAGVTDNDIVETLRQETARIEAFVQAGIVGDQNTVDSINAGTYDGPLPEKRDDGGWLSIYDNLRILKIAGINHRQGISRYVGRVECALVPEPDNEFDSDAIKVVAEDSHHLGYIPSNQTDFVRSMARDQFPYRCTAFIRDAEDEDDSHQFFVGHVYIKKKQ